MLPRIGAALAKHIQPLGQFVGDRPANPKFQKFQPPRQESQSEEKPKQSSPELKPVTQPPPNAATERPPPTALSKPGATATFLQLFQFLQNGKFGLMKWLGKKSYQASARNRKKGAKFRKGTMLDQRAE